MESIKKPTVAVADEILERLKAVKVDGFISGSVRFKCTTTKSDIDICIPIWDKEAVIAWCNTNKFEMEESNYNNGIKFMFGDYAVNIVPLHPHEYVAWYRAAKMIDSVKGLFSVGTDVKKRHAIHEILVSTNKLAIESLVNSKNYKDFL